MIAVYTWSAGEVRHLERVVRRDGGLRLRRLPARFGIIEHPDGPIVFDTGYHESLRRRLRGVARAYHRVVPWSCPAEHGVGARLRSLGYAPSDVQLVVLSHLHADHVAGLVDLPDAPIALTRTAWRAVHASSRLALASRGYFTELLPADLPTRAEWLEPPPPCHDLAACALDLLGDGTLGVVSLPGHAPGQVGLWVRPADVLFVADASFSRDAIRADATPSRLFMAAVHDDVDATRTTLAHLRAWTRRDPALRIVACHAWEGPPDGRLA